MSRVECLLLGGFLWSAKEHGVDERAVFGLGYKVVYDAVMVGVVCVTLMMVGNSPEEGRITCNYCFSIAVQWPKHIVEAELFFAPDRLVRQLANGAYIPPERAELWAETLPLLKEIISEQV